jgi:hypothetical protein
MVHNLLREEAASPQRPANIKAPDEEASVAEEWSIDRYFGLDLTAPFYGRRPSAWRVSVRHPPQTHLPFADEI